MLDPNGKPSQVISVVCDPIKFVKNNPPPPPNKEKLIPEFPSSICRSCILIQSDTYTYLVLKYLFENESMCNWFFSTTFLSHPFFTHRSIGAANTINYGGKPYKVWGNLSLYRPLPRPDQGRRNLFPNTLSKKSIKFA